MTPNDLRVWRKTRRLTRADLAAALGISPSRLLDYELGYTRRGKGERDTPAPVPRLVELALEALAARERVGPAAE